MIWFLRWQYSVHVGTKWEIPLEFLLAMLKSHEEFHSPPSLPSSLYNKYYLLLLNAKTLQSVKNWLLGPALEMLANKAPLTVKVVFRLIYSRY